jgi:O-antigen/teichoic acid export membrane protein
MTASGGEIARFFRSSVVYALGNALSRVGAFVLLPLYTRYLAVEQYGELELFYVIGAVASGFLSVGIAHATLRFYFEYQEPAERNAVVSTNLLASMAISTAGALAVGAFAADIARLLFGDAALATGVWIVLATLVFELSSQVSLAYVRARERAGLFVAVALAKLLLQVAVNTYMLVVLDAGVIGVLAGNLATVVLGWLVLSGFTVRHCGLRFSWAKLTPVLRYGYPFLLTTMVALVAANVDRLLITSLLTLQALGLYALAVKFASLLAELVGEPFNQAYGAFRFTIMGREDAAAIQARIVRYLLIVSCFAALGLAYFIEAVLHVMSAPAYWEAAKLVPLLAAAAVLRVVAYPLQTGILVRKETRHLFHVGVVVAIVNSAGGFVLISWLGLYGACLTLVLSSAVYMLLTNHFAQRYFPVAYEAGRLARIVAITLAFYFAALPLEQLGPWPAFGLKWVLLGLYLAAIAGLGGLAPGEWAGARDRLSGRLDRLRR